MNRQAWRRDCFRGLGTRQADGGERRLRLGVRRQLGQSEGQRGKRREEEREGRRSWEGRVFGEKERKSQEGEQRFF